MPGLSHQLRLSRHPDGELRDERLKDRRDLLPLGKIGIPLFLFHPKVLADPAGECHLASPVLITSPRPSRLHSQPLPLREQESR